jgi:hypothetical protein
MKTTYDEMNNRLKHKKLAYDDWIDEKKEPVMSLVVSPSSF